MMGADDAGGLSRRSAFRLAATAFAVRAFPIHASYLEKRRMPFAPKFIDLVRNYTTTAGTDDFVLGPAVNGFRSIADTLQVGDSFYYSATGIDTPAETEVGRGTLLDGGTVSRDPVTGTRTSFSAGTKSLALVAAADWFADVDQLRTSQVNVRSFGAKGDSNDDGSAGTDDTAAIQAGLDYLGGVGGGTLHFPAGTYRTSSFLEVPPRVVLAGAGRMASKIVGTHPGGGGATAGENARNGSILYSTAPINSSTPLQVRIEGLWLHNSNPANEGACFYQEFGSLIVIRDCELTGCKWGVILDQTEDVTIETSVIASFVAGGAGLWIVNGADLTPGASSGFSNIINIRDCQLNVIPNSYCVVDDGGYEHSYSGSNFVSGISALRVAGVNGLVVESCYFEGQTSEIVHLDSLSLAGNFVGGSAVAITGGQWSPTAGNACIKGFNSPGSVTATSGQWSSPSMPPLANAALFWSIALINPGLAGYPDAANFCDGTATGHHFESARVKAGRDGRVGIPNYSGVTGGITFSPGAKAGYIETFNSAGARQGYGFLLNGTALQFAADGTATSFQFLDPVSCTGSITSTGGGVGYAAGAGGSVVQPTTKSTGVTLNKLSGQITLNAEALEPSATATFKLTNSQIAAGDLLILNHVSGGTLGAYSLNAHGSAAGSVNIDVTNVTPNSLSEPIVIGFAVIKAVTA